MNLNFRNLEADCVVNKTVVNKTVVKAMSRLFLNCAAALFFSILSTASSIASPILVSNYSFESPATTSLTHGNAPGWTQLNNGGQGGVYNPYEYVSDDRFYIGANSTTDPANGGSGFLGIVGENVGYSFNNGPGGGFRQTLAATVAADTVYTLTVSVGNRAQIHGEGPFAGSLIELIAGNTVIASSTDNVGPTVGSFQDQVTISANSNTFADLIGDQITIMLLTTNALRSGIATDWDNVRLDAASQSTVPEPSTLILLAVGSVGFVINQHRRRRRAA